MGKLKIYLATPYSYKNEDGSENWEKMEERFHEVTKMAGKLLLEGYIVFSPITHCHPIAILHALPRTYEFWLSFDEHFVKWCDEVWIYQLPGWEKSKGVEMEVQLAEKYGKPVKFIPVSG